MPNQKSPCDLFMKLADNKLLKIQKENHFAGLILRGKKVS